MFTLDGEETSGELTDHMKDDAYMSVLRVLLKRNRSMQRLVWALSAITAVESCIIVWLMATGGKL